ncbi:transcriptional regulator [Candidatus Dependentiae bacterium HGW-Dependentiae-1]|nr:MAG: transcriptional regulator [Candidatus Dependentiae bacterium HGW-Dependentiae-1]
MAEKKVAMKKVAIVDNELLKSHERTRKNHVEKLTAQIKYDGHIWNPILVDKKTMIILDGHHRRAALKKLGLSRVPVRFVNYMSDEIGVASWRKGERVTKKTVVDAGLSGKLLPIKTSRHLFSKEGFIFRIPLVKLK